MRTELPPVVGFLVAAAPVGGAAPQAPAARFATAGRRSAFAAEPAGQLWAGHLVAGAPEQAAPGDGNPAGFATDAGAALLLAGELYNRAELALALGDPGAAQLPDARLLLAVYRRYGAHAFRLANGRFAALLGDGTRVIAASDHAGGVPLHVRPVPGGLLAATEAKALVAAAPGGAAGPVPGAREVPGAPGLYQVPAGAVVVFGLDGTGPAPRTVRTWTPALHRVVRPEGEAVAAVRAALERAVRARLGTGPAPTAVLSGGIDSSAVAALAAGAGAGLHTLSMGTDRRDEFAEARLVADRLAEAHGNTTHTEIRIDTAELLGELPWAVWASETDDPEIIEYLLPLTALYRRVPGPAGRRILTGYGADIPLGGMHREDRLPALDDAVAHDMATFDGLNEMTPVLSGIAGHWTTHPYWDREVLDLLTGLEAGLKRRYGRDKWVLREAVADLLPEATVRRPKLGVHEGSGTTSSFTLMLAEYGVAGADVAAAKRAVVRRVHRAVVTGGTHPAEVDLRKVAEEVTR
ncbi:hypothetical protein GCM10010495_10310 [Kitasatospora herbaricolor]|uniref:asparagine synthase-related protein n=1 Tax=Kitasatospora herbaricolor TaxID=68217 RepID=UPI00174C9055|nr:asparagine synthase-related protein [Kitasatospora herbaricolor]MDQ0309534.1 (carboxyethyl)arginine beta-lactam-synthase [Kitasatospora herbaricolor]GGV01212.1 hypothetical protein GCM10010495_10310 [Kitasatospora herbaricolor]